MSESLVEVTEIMRFCLISSNCDIVYVPDNDDVFFSWFSQQGFS